MSNEEILEIAMRQSAEDLNCKASDFMENIPILSPAGIRSTAKVYYKEPITCNMISYGNNVVASVVDEYKELVEEYLHRYEFYHCFETPNMHWLNDRMMQKGQKICFMAEYFLPDLNKLQPLFCDYECRVLQPSDFVELYKPEWGNALCELRKEKDVLGVGAYDGEKLVGLAGCSADCEKMWQIGIDVLPEYRRRGIASALTAKLALETIRRGKVPFYCAAWSNIRSVRNAIKSGFLPAWVEMTVKPMNVVDEMN